MITKIKGGWKVHERGIKSLPKEVAERLGVAFKDVAEKIAAAAKQNLSKNGNIRTGSLETAIKVKSKCGLGSGGKWTIYSMVGVDKDFLSMDKKGNDIIPYKYYHLIELGFTQRDGFWRKPTAPFRPAVEKYKPQLKTEIQKNMEGLK